MYFFFFSFLQNDSLSCVSGRGGVCLLVILKAQFIHFLLATTEVEALVTFKPTTVLKLHEGREFNPMAMQRNPVTAMCYNVKRQT